MQRSDIIYQYKKTVVKPPSKSRLSLERGGWTRRVGVGLLALALGGLSGPLLPAVRLEANYAF